METWRIVAITIATYLMFCCFYWLTQLHLMTPKALKLILMIMELKDHWKEGKIPKWKIIFSYKFKKWKK